jgi:hypothetical protein
MKNVLILALVALLIFSLIRPSAKPTTVTTIDTTYIIRADTLVKKVLVHSVDTSYDTTTDPKFIPDTSYDVLKKQFEDLSKELTKKTTYKDTLLLDSIGFVHISDTVQFNELVNRRYTYSYKLPIVTKTTTKYAEPKRQMYFGGDINTAGLSVGLMYKTKKDRLIGLNVGMQQSKLVYGFQTYIPFKK